jgi:hypothetical protein
MAVLRYRRWVLSTGDLAEEGEQRELLCPQPCFRNLEHCGLTTVLVKPVILRWLVHDDDGSITPSTTDRVRSATHPSSWLAALPYQDYGRAAFFPASRTLVPVATVGEGLSASSLAGWELRPTSVHQLSNGFVTHPPSYHGFA